MPQKRKPLCQYDADAIDWSHRLFFQTLEKYAAADSSFAARRDYLDFIPRDTPLGVEGYRAFWLRALAYQGIKEKWHPRRVAAEFITRCGLIPIPLKMPGFRGRRPGRPRKRPTPLEVEAWVQSLRGPLPKQRGPGRPSAGVVAIRTWTIDALCEVSSLTLQQAIDHWDYWFGGLGQYASGREHALAEDASGGEPRRQFYRNREQVRKDLPF